MGWCFGFCLLCLLVWTVGPVTGGLGGAVRSQGLQCWWRRAGCSAWLCACAARSRCAGRCFACSVGCVLPGGLGSAGVVSRCACDGIAVQWEQQRGVVLLEEGALVLGWCGGRGVTGWCLRAACGEGHVEDAECACSRRATSAGAERKVGVVECRSWLCSMETQGENAVFRGGRACSCSSIWVNAVRQTRWCAARHVGVRVGRVLGVACERCAAVHLHRGFPIVVFFPATPTVNGNDSTMY